MFERFTQQARQSLLFARAKTSDRDGEEISAEDLVVGLLRATPDTVLRFASQAAADRIRPRDDGEQWLLRVETRDDFKTPLNREIPFSAAAKTVIERAVEEANALNHQFVRPEHVLLGLLRDEDTEVWRTLNEAGVRLREVRRVLGEEPDTGEPPTDWESER